ncbi:drug/metabolite DMT transporter permease [Cyclobacterium qasimii]|uniref:Permease of the drug/metabolite transporter (DMT) superfamily n=1 Tax=Cyclobacterium qasimii M12-11B TaxID=641524 RepID=S7WX79_9BACT|nr:drug/metabolite DMT transporter permease [Cyclobacterium qasimii]EPR68588.1 Permease of the drug/metabolite transporter (DMT) superfamily [Cyclobacterium qasimii M12-11B]
MDNNDLPPNDKKWNLYSSKKIFLPTILILLYLTILFVPISLEQESHLLVFFGRFHPLVLHFPIVLILITTGFILMGFFNPNFNKPIIIRSLLWASVFFSFITIVAGFLLFIAEAYSGDMVNNHLDGALITGISISVCLIIYESNLHQKLKGGFVFTCFLD